MGWILYWQMYCWLAGWRVLAAFAFFLLFLFHFISFQDVKIDRGHQDHTAFGIEIDQNLRFQKG